MFSMDFDSSYIKVAGIAVVITLVLSALVLIHYQQISKRTGTIVIPAGNTYLGPNTPPENAPSDTTWKTFAGHTYPYSFSAPESLNLTTFQNDIYDIYAIDCCNIAPSANVLIGVDPKANPKESKLAYVQNWWHQFSALKSVTSIDRFTNASGLKGYKARYVNSAGETPNLDVFFEVPDRPELVIHLASGTLDSATFDKIVDSVRWGK